MATDARSANRNYPVPHADNMISEDFPRLITALGMIDTDVAGLLTSMAGKASASHTHAIGDVDGLQSALDGKAATGHSHSLGNLTNVSTSGAASGQYLGFNGSSWQPITVQIGHVSGLQTALNEKANTSALGTAAAANTGTSVGNVPVVGGNGKLPAAVLPEIEAEPAGVIKMWGAGIASIPSGWFLCDGRPVTETYPALRQTLIDAGSPHGHNGTDPLSPNLVDRFIVGAGGAYTPGDTGGAAEVTLTEAQMPEHTHTGSAASAGNHGHNFSYRTTNTSGSSVIVHTGDVSGFPNASASGAIAAAGAHAHTLSLNNAGNGEAHENLPPYYALCYIMKG